MNFGRNFCAACVAAASFAVTPLLAQSPVVLGWQPVRPAMPILQAQAVAPAPLAPVPPEVNGSFTSHHSVVTGQPMISPPVVANQPVVSAPIVAAPPPVYDPYCAPAPCTSGLTAPVFTPGVCPTPVVPAQPACAYPGFYIFGEIFQRDAYFPNSPYAFAPGDVTVGGVVTPTEGVVPLSTELDSDWGYRVGAGWRFQQGWDLGAAYESFSTSGASAFGDLPGVLEFQFGDVSNLIGNIGSEDAVSETINVDYQIIDLEAGRQFCICETLVLRPYAGVRFASLDHNRDNVFTDEIAPGPPPVLDTYSIARSTTIDAIGLRIGNYLGWKFGLSGFQVFARGELSLLQADMNVTRTETSSINPGPVVSTVTISQSFQQLVPITEIAAGARYDFARWSISGGYELENWFNVVNDIVYGDIGTPEITINRGDIGFSGWFVRAAYNF